MFPLTVAYFVCNFRTEMNHATISTRTTPLLPTLPFELLECILYKLPVKLLLQLRCICKQWKSRISSTEFTVNYLCMAKASKNHHHLMGVCHATNMGNRTRDGLLYYNPCFWYSPIPSILSMLSISHTLISIPDILNVNPVLRVSSYDGILCFTVNDHFPLLWNPSIRRFRLFSPAESKHRPMKIHGKREKRVQNSFYTFGYHDLSYKIVAVSSFFSSHTNKVSIFTLDTDSWRRIDDFPCLGKVSEPGLYLSGTVNWLVSNFIVSLDLASETYNQLLLPPTTGEGRVTLGVLRDSLCLCASNNDMHVVDVWMMSEFGNNDSWNILYSVPYMGGDEVPNAKALYITEDEKLLMYYRHSMPKKLGLYDSKNGTSHMFELQNSSFMDPIVYLESFISP